MSGGGTLKLCFTEPEPADDWHNQICREPDCLYRDRPQHIHTPWGGGHIDIVNDDGETVERLPCGLGPPTV